MVGNHASSDNDKVLKTLTTIQNDPAWSDMCGRMQELHADRNALAAAAGIAASNAVLAAGGNAVSKSELQAGDLVFFRGLGHMGMYIGGGNFIHAPRTGDVVKISSLSEPYRVANWVGARRVR